MRTKNKKSNLRKRLNSFIKSHIGLTVVVVAAILLEMISAVMFYTAQDIIQRTVDRLVNREMNAIYLSIRNHLSKVEVTVDNMAWVVAEDLENPDRMFSITRNVLENNSSFSGCGLAFVPNYYPEKGRWFEPCSGRRAGGAIETLQLGSPTHDYFQAEFYIKPIEKNSGQWCEPYRDSVGAQAMVTDYSIPVRDTKGNIVAVLVADLSLDWLDGVMVESKLYKSTQRFIVTGSGNLLAGKDNFTYRSALDQINQDSDREGYVTLKNEKGEKQLVFYHPVGGMTDWILINVLDDHDVFGKLRHVRLMLLLMVLAGLLLIGFIVWRTSRSFERLRKVNAEKERIGGELRVASQIQQSMLPNDQHKQDGVIICGSLVPAREVGGDLYDYFVRDEKLFFCIGDVSGKGPASAMFMAVTCALFRSSSAHESNPARIMHNINETMCQGNDSNMFVTLFIGILDLPTGRLRYCDAGHDCPMIIKDGELHIESCNAHIPVGVFDDTKYDVQEMQLASESTIFLYTDGLTEAKDKDRKQFGLERVEEVLGKCAKRELMPKEILETVSEEVRLFVNGAEQSDDLTMLAINYSPRQFDSEFVDSLTIKNDVHEVSRFSEFMKSVTNKLNIEKSLAKQLRLAVEEAVVNAIDYAYTVDTDGEITVKILSDGHTMNVQIIDSGIPFDPTTKEKADTSLSAEDRQIGGLGILLVRELMDTINYERIDGKNVLTLIKHII